MKSRILLTAAAFLAVLPAFAASGNVMDARDVVYFGEPRPVRMRLHIQIDGEAYTRAFDAYIKVMFDYYDRNDDGALSKEEVENLPNVQMLFQQTQGGFGFFYGDPGGNQNAKLTDVDTDKDGRCSLAEMADYYRRGGFSPIQITPGRRLTQSMTLTKNLFTQLDKDKDGKLSRAEISDMEKVLLRLDVDENELVSVAELTPPRANPFDEIFGVEYMYGGQPQARQEEGQFLMLNPGEGPARVIKRLMTRDKNKDRKLSREEIGLAEDTFKALDVDTDGNLDADELVKWLRMPADLEAVIRMGKIGDGLALAELSEGSCCNSCSVSSMVENAGKSGLLLGMGKAQIDVRRSRDGSNRAQMNRRNFEVQFQFLAGDKDYLEKSRIEKEAQYMMGMFKVADRDSDGKLYRKEFNRYLDMTAASAQCFTVLTISDLGRGLFEILDSNRDGKLSPREMRTAWARLGPCDRNGDGAIDKDEVPQQFQLMLSRGQPTPGSEEDDYLLSFYGYGEYKEETKREGPVWFQKMDKNRDGDITLAEFVGSEEEFKALDEDGDGLISLKEATKAEERLRKKTEEKK